MPKIRRKTEFCLNCNYPFKENEEFCPRCGQENDNKLKSLKLLFIEFFHDLLSVDTRFYRSIYPFLFKPGKLTNEYNQGRRKNYVTPIRLYLTTSFIYFFIFSVLILRNINDDKQGFVEGKEQSQSKKKTKTENLLDSPKTVNVNNDSLKKNIEKKLEASKKDDKKVKTSIFGIDSDEITRLSRKKGMTEKVVLDSLDLENTLFNRLVVRQANRLSGASEQELIRYFVEKIPIMLFFLLPVFAFLLKLIYIRQKRYYIEHLIFTFHIHSFFFLVFIILIPILSFYHSQNEIITLPTVAILFLYSYKSFRNVYQQNRFKTLLKMFLWFLAYLFILSVGITVAIVISLALY